MMLELMHGYPMPLTPVQVCFDGAIWFFYQDGDDEKIVMASSSVDRLLPWLRLAARARDREPEMPILEIPGGRFPGIFEQSKIFASWVREPGAGCPAVRLAQGLDSVEFDADEAPFLASMLESVMPFEKTIMSYEQIDKKSLQNSRILKAKEAMNKTFGKYGVDITPITKEEKQFVERNLHLPRPQDVLVHCPRCLAAQGKLIDCPAGQNEVRCSVCDFVFQFRYTPDMTEGT